MMFSNIEFPRCVYMWFISLRVNKNKGLSGIWLGNVGVKSPNFENAKKIQRKKCCLLLITFGAQK